MSQKLVKRFVKEAKEENDLAWSGENYLAWVDWSEVGVLFSREEELEFWVTPGENGTPYDNWRRRALRNGRHLSMGHKAILGFHDWTGKYWTPNFKLSDL